MTKFNPEIRELAREISSAALGRAVYAISPLMQVFDVHRRDHVYRLLAIEFSALEGTLETLLAKPNQAKRGNT